MTESLTLEDLVDTVICPTCRVTAGARCITRAGKPAREPHGRRFEAVEEAAGITQHRAAVRREAQAHGKWWSNGIDPKAEGALLAAYTARRAASALPRPAGAA
ncbi:zinc finger domain-containing protein [Streptomyces sp. NPDC054950]